MAHSVSIQIFLTPFWKKTTVKVSLMLWSLCGSGGVWHGGVVLLNLTVFPSLCVWITWFVLFCCIFSFLSLKEKELSFWFCSKVLWSIEFASHVAWWFIRFLCVGAISPWTFSVFAEACHFNSCRGVFIFLKLLSTWDINILDEIQLCYSGHSSVLHRSTQTQYEISWTNLSCITLF